MTAKSRSTLKSDADAYQQEARDHDEAIKNKVKDVVDTTGYDQISISVGSESSNTIPLTFQLQESDGSTNVSKQVEYHAAVYDTDGNIAAKADFKFTNVSTGTAKAPSTPDEPNQWVQSDSSGKAVVDLDDVNGGSGKTVRVEVDCDAPDVAANATTVTFD